MIPYEKESIRQMGFELENQVQMDTQMLTTYRNEAGETFTFLQQAIQTQYLFDNQNTEEEKVEVGGVDRASGREVKMKLSI